MPLELTEEQQRVVEERADHPIEIVDPRTHHTYVLIAQERYEQMCSLLMNPSYQPHSGHNGDREIPPGVRRSQEAFWRELPQLAKKKSNLGKRVCYHGDELIGIARSEVELIRQCLQRRLEDHEYYIDIIERQDIAPWEIDELPAPNPAYLEE